MLCRCTFLDLLCCLSGQRIETLQSFHALSLLSIAALEPAHPHTCTRTPVHTHTKKTCFLRKYFEQHLILMLVILLITFSFYKETQWPTKLDEKHMNTFTVSMSSKEKILILSSCHTFIYKEKWNGFNIIVWIWQIRNFAHVLYSCLLISEHVSSWVSEFSNTSYPTKTS